MECPFLEIKGAAAVEGEAVRGVMRIGRVDSANDALAHIGLAVAVRVLEVHKVGGLSDQRAAVI